MFCYQCQEALNCTGCVKTGVCGKDAKTSDAQDVLIYTAKGVANWALEAKLAGRETDEADVFVTRALFTTITNVSFSEKRVMDLIKEGLELKKRMKQQLSDFARETKLPDTAYWQPKNDAEILSGAGMASILSETDEDIRSLKELLVYGVKGIAAYADHALVLGYKDKEIFRFFHKALDAASRDGYSADALLALIMEAGSVSVKTMALLDKANTETYGIPEITMADTGTKEGKAILVSGHDLRDIYELLEQTEGKGINVYTHGEMLPALSYPKLKKFKHLTANYGGAWWNQQKEFAAFNGAILMTTNCLTKPLESYEDRIFTTGLVAFDGIKHVGDRKPDGKKDFSGVIECALKQQGLKETKGNLIPIGFNHSTILGLADKIVEAIKTGAIKKFIVMGGCDGRQKEREQYTQKAENLPKDNVILTAGCAKYRYNMLDMGDIGGIPRVIDAGQCNDSYSLAVVALKLKEVFGANDINDLPIEFDIAWYEQKAVAVLLALLFLGFKNIALGPTLPAFVSPNVGAVLAEKFGIKQSAGKA